ncbi:helix-turn-helix domain-containing protein [Azospirillum sp. B4]|uniref:helix-turn-helix domain-containing protein n=1 Tax=Azospirillum sp. B4 TaxID=95605 RepID=UPI0005C91F86|nr:helix-turn-helix transcriptional regulator [Azospirillum sp. B4]
MGAQKSSVTGALASAYSLSKRGEGPNPIDIHVGNRLRLRRTLLGLSQEILGEAVGITFQQLQKYERGMNRISASRLFNLSQVLGVPVGYFFEDLPATEQATRIALGSEEGETMARRETLELVRAYYRVPDGAVRRRAFDLLKALGGDVREAEDA